MSITIKNGQATLVKATFKDAQGNICEPLTTVGWSSNNTGVATVLASQNSYRHFFDRAIITAVSTGTATITATSTNEAGGSITATISVATYDNEPAAVAINVIP